MIKIEGRNGYKVLDHGLVALVESMGNDLSIVRNARVSYDAEWRAGEDEGKDAKLIQYLVKNQHTSPLEAVTFTFEVKAPIFVLRQWHRHRTWCLAGDSNIEFIRPCDGKPYQMSIKALCDKWNYEGTPKRKRSVRSHQEYMRHRISKMRLRFRKADGTLGSTFITDVWQSGTKTVLKIVAGRHTIKCSEDHLFLTEKGYLPAKDLLGEKVCIIGNFGGTNINTSVDTVRSEADEVWVEFLDGHDISSHGRVRTWWGQGSRYKKESPVLRKISTSNSGRAVVAVQGKLYQVSRLVAEAFLPNTDGNPFVCHINDNPSDNHVSNLYWGDAATNTKDSVRNGTRVSSNFKFEEVVSIARLGEEPVYDLTVDAEEHNFVANRFVVHNCFNEISARYAELPEEFYLPEIEQITTQHSSNKQMRTDEQHPYAEAFRNQMMMQNKTSFALYKEMLNDGVPRELARTVLPVATYSHMFATVNLSNLFKFIALRDHPHAQYEIKVYAQAMLELAREVCPIAVAALCEKNKVK